VSRCVCAFFQDSTSIPSNLRAGSCEFAASARPLMMPAAGWELALGRACVELPSAWLQLACREDQREPQFALTLGCKTQHDHNNTQLQLVRVYIDIGSVTCMDGEAAEACERAVGCL
jgi:hypothetical protein